jgi:methyltransferase (TIGR00027 family)
LFHDPFAGTLAGQRGAEVARTMSGGWAITVRTRVFDDLLLSTIQDHGVQGVLNLGAGLDTRPYRLDLPARLQWIEVDLAATIEHKERLLADHQPRCQLVRRSGNLEDRGDRERLLALIALRPTLIITEGVLHYLPQNAVKELALAASSHPHLRWWLLDVADPLTIRWGRRTTAAVDLWRFTPENGAEFFRPLGWPPQEVRSGWLEARRLNRQSLTMRLAWALSPEGKRSEFRRLWTYALLEHRHVPNSD